MSTAKIAMNPVKSEQIKEAGYDPATETMHLRFVKNNALYSYTRFTQKHWDAFQKAESKGAFFHKHVRGRFNDAPVQEHETTAAAA